MKISLDEINTIEKYSYLEIGRGQTSNGKPIIIRKELPIYLGEFENTETNIDFLIICSDLQGITKKESEYKLVGEELPEFLNLLIKIEISEIENPSIGVILCGDLYTNLEKRGSSGDVRTVWHKFNEYFDWVTGVAGNHDKFGNQLEMKEFKSTENIHLLHKEIINLDKLKIGGISGIIGREGKLNRIDEKDYLDSLKKLLKKNLDFIVLHETPDFPNLNFIGNEKIREVIEKGNESIICCGHCFWEKTLIELKNKSKILNVDSKVVILKNLNTKTRS